MSQENVKEVASKEIKERGILRRLFTTAANQLEHLLDSNIGTETELKCGLRKIEQLHNQISNLDCAIKNLLLEENVEDSVINKEIVTAVDYSNRFLTIQTKFELATKRTDRKEKEKPQTRNYKLPEIKFKKFDGSIRNWLPFWGQFKKIDADRNLDEDDKYFYLLQSMEEGTEVYSLVESYPATGSSYQQCLTEIKQRYAREDLLIEYYVREMLGLVLQRKADVGELYDKLNANLRALETLGISKYQAFILPLVESALPIEILRLWERSKGSLLEKKSQEEILEKLMLFLKTELESIQRIQLSKNLTTDHQEKEKPQVATASCLVSQTQTNIRKSLCIWCDKDNHSSMECYKINKLSIEQRRNILTKKKACPICLKIGHHPRTCKAYIKCLICQKRHSTLLCTEKREDKSKDTKTTTSLSSHSNNTETLLQTLVVNVRNGDKVLPVRVLFDNGSQRSYIREDVAEKLKLVPTGKEELHHCLFGNIKTKSVSHDIYNFTVESLDSKFKINIEALSRNAICGDIPILNMTNNVYKMLKRHQINLTNENDCKEVGILLGADYSGFLLTSSIISLENGLIAIKTKLGWTVQGRQISISPGNISTSLFCVSSACNNDFADFWTFETVGILDPAETRSRAEGEIEAVCNFEKTVKTTSDGRYEVALPFKVGFDDLLSNYDKAKKRLVSNTNKLMSCGKYKDYDEIIDEWHASGIIERVPTDVGHSHDTGHYLPHKAVYKNSSLTSAIRPVFDASCTDKNGLSLNACLMKGINYIAHIPKLLIGFRKGAIGVTSDIAKAFLQISLQPNDRNYLKFLWWADESLKEIVEFRHCRVVFGLTSSPFLLSATLMYHLDSIKGQYEQTATLLKKSFYVDNCLTSLETEEEMRKFIDEAKEIMKMAKFDLRLWTTSPLQINEAGKDIVSVLGINWDTVSDSLSCNTSVLPPLTAVGKLTKRSILSLTQKIFDPIGFICPVTLPPRLLLQEMWCRGLGWDEQAPEDLEKKFIKWYNNIHYLTQCKVPRRLTSDNINNCNKSLHLFCDASKHAMAACIFLRSEYNGNISLQLVAAKSRVAPPKNISIPRLELTAAVLGVRLLVETKNSLQLPDCNELYWTDSTVALYWIRNNLSWNVFVGNRVREIRECTKTENWSHISGTSNWADLASRGCDAKELLESRWTEGPEFLLHSPAEWPKSSVTADRNEVTKELKSSVKSCCNVNITTNENLSERLLYFSKYVKIVRVVAWILRFANNCLKKKETKICKIITAEEYDIAEKKLLLLIQKENEDNLKVKCKNIYTYYDMDGLVRIKTKLLLTNLPENTKSPIILPAKSEIVYRLVEQNHRLLQHAGVNMLITHLRKSYWIFGIRRLVRSVIANCMICKRFRAKQMQAPIAPLPANRVESSVPFEISGVDLAGPLFLKNGSKCWIVLFTCSVYRAVHLELTDSLSTEAFIRTLRRFIARRGRIKVMYSDNGTNFIGTKNLLDNIDWQEVTQKTCTDKIIWKFNAPTGAWWGGFFERLIRVMKDLLRKVLGNTVLSYDELFTIICECESIINNRPLTYVQDDKAESLEPLTPACFLQPLSTADTTDLDLIDARSLNVRLRYLQKLRDDFRHRFKTEYLTELIQRGKEKNSYEEVKEGQVVLLETDEKRIKWPLGVVTKIYPGKDNVIRTAQVKTAIGFKVRPIQKLYPLELTRNIENQALLPTENQTEDSLSQTPVNTDCTSFSGNSRGVERTTRLGRQIRMPSKYKL